VQSGIDIRNGFSMNAINCGACVECLPMVLWTKWGIKKGFDSFTSLSINFLARKQLK